MQPPPSRAVVIQHVAFEDLGTLGPALRAQGLQIDTVQAGVDSLADISRQPPALLIVLGGPIGVYEHASYPWLLDEIELLAARLSERRPTLGICLGAQLMAAALGSRVYPGERGKEIGWAPVSPAKAGGAANPLAPLFDADVSVLHWHGDTFDLPAGTTHLAATERYPSQAFGIGSHALALQFHAEARASTLERWYIGHAAELSQAGIQVPGLRSGSQRHGPPLERAAEALWTPWLRSALTAGR
jgi:GMP synthase (glutamine-hydrolysing)